MIQGAPLYAYLIVRPVSILPPVLVAAAVAATALALSQGSCPSTMSAAVAFRHREDRPFTLRPYYPASVTVKVGTTVIFTNEEGVEHTATSNAEGLFETGTLEKGQSVRLKMNKVGSFSYPCSFLRRGIYARVRYRPMLAITLEITASVFAHPSHLTVAHPKRTKDGEL